MTETDNKQKPPKVLEVREKRKVYAEFINAMNNPPVDFSIEVIDTPTPRTVRLLDFALYNPGTKNYVYNYSTYPRGFIFGVSRVALEARVYKEFRGYYPSTFVKCRYFFDVPEDKRVEGNSHLSSYYRRDYNDASINSIADSLPDGSLVTFKYTTAFEDPETHRRSYNATYYAHFIVKKGYSKTYRLRPLEGEFNGIRDAFLSGRTPGTQDYRASIICTNRTVNDRKHDFLCDSEVRIHTKNLKMLPLTSHSPLSYVYRGELADLFERIYKRYEYSRYDPNPHLTGISLKRFENIIEGYGHKDKWRIIDEWVDTLVMAYYIYRLRQINIDLATITNPDIIEKERNLEDLLKQIKKRSPFYVIDKKKDYSSRRYIRL